MLLHLLQPVILSIRFGLWPRSIWSKRSPVEGSGKRPRPRCPGHLIHDSPQCLCRTHLFLQSSCHPVEWLRQDLSGHCARARPARARSAPVRTRIAARIPLPCKLACRRGSALTFRIRQAQHLGSKARLGFLPAVNVGCLEMLMAVFGTRHTSSKTLLCFLNSTGGRVNEDGRAPVQLEFSSDLRLSA